MHVGKQVAASVEGDLDRCVPKLALDVFGIFPLSDQQGRACVPEIVESDAPQFGSFQCRRRNPLEPCPEMKKAPKGLPFGALRLWVWFKSGLHHRAWVRAGFTLAARHTEGMATNLYANGRLLESRSNPPVREHRMFDRVVTPFSVHLNHAQNCNRGLYVKKIKY